MPLLERSAAQALRSIHTKEAMPYLMELLDSSDPGVPGEAMSGICLFVRNAPVLAQQSTSSLDWMQSREPAPFRTEQTDSHCFTSPVPSSWIHASHSTFWKRWWREHEAEVMR